MSDISLRALASTVEERKFDPTTHLLFVALLDGVGYIGSNHLQDRSLKDNIRDDMSVHNEDISLAERLKSRSSYKVNTNDVDICESFHHNILFVCDSISDRIQLNIVLNVDRCHTPYNESIYADSMISTFRSYNTFLTIRTKPRFTLSNDSINTTNNRNDETQPFVMKEALAVTSALNQGS